MKILLKRATYYFNDGIVLGPQSREAEVDLDSMSDSAIRKLNAGIRTGVIEVTDGAEAFETKIKALSEKKDVEEVKAEPVIEQEIKEEKEVEVATEEVAKDEEEKVEEDTTTVKKPTTRRKTTSTK